MNNQVNIVEVSYSLMNYCESKILASRGREQGRIGQAKRKEGERQKLRHISFFINAHSPLAKGYQTLIPSPPKLVGLLLFEFLNSKYVKYI